MPQDIYYYTLKTASALSGMTLDPTSTLFVGTKCLNNGACAGDPENYFCFRSSKT